MQDLPSGRSERSGVERNVFPYCERSYSWVFHSTVLCGGVSSLMTNDSNVLWWTATINALAVFSAPAIALWVQRRLDDGRAAQTRRQEIFKTLWVNRRRPYWVARVDALNMIDIEFYKFKSVRDACRAMRFGMAPQAVQ